MIETTSGKSNFPTNYINKNQSIDSLTDQENDRTVQQEKNQFTPDQVNLTYSAESGTTYNRSMSLESKVGDGYDLMRGLVLNMFKEQGIDYKIATDNSEIDISTVTPEEAQELIADEGYFGVEKTSDRIFKFAVGMAGGDPAKIDAIREGVKNGFQEALDAFGGQLPDISYDTYDAVMKKLDDWAGVEISPQSQI
jgi:hypothetical protein